MIEATKPPPVSRWARKSEAASRCGVTPRAFVELIRDDSSVRLQYLGKRGLMYVAAEDIDPLVSRLQAGGAR